MSGTPKEYYLMHKDIRVGLMEVTEDGAVKRLRRNEAASAHFPVGGQMNDTKFHDWWRDRAIPKTRHGAKTALQKLGYGTTENALLDNLGLSLTDCYWICPREENLTWNEVNLFSNDFVDSFGEITINRNYETDLRNKTRFSCAASQGELQKKWCIGENGRRCVVKGNYGYSYQQSLNEVFASNLHHEQGFDRYAEYSTVRLTTGDDTEGLGCMCYSFCDEKLESISAWELLQTVKFRENESLYFPLRQACLNFGMAEEEFTGFLDYQIMTDFLISNTDRHMNNIAILRDPDTLQVFGFAPIYDSGNSMFYDLPFEKLSEVRFEDIITHSFIKKEIQLLKYVHDRTLVDTAKLTSDFSIYEQDIVERRMRIPKLKKLFERKVAALERFQHGKDIWKVDSYR